MSSSTRVHWGCVLLLAGSWALPCVAQVEATGPLTPSSNSELYLRSQELIQEFAHRGLSFSGQFVHDWSREWHDPDSPPSGFGRYSVDLLLALDGQKALGWKGASGLVRLKQHINEFGFGDEDARQLYSNIDAPSRTTLYEFFLEQRLDGDSVRVKGGRIDANSEFAVVESAGDFLNSSMGYSPTIVAFPTYPEPKLGLGVFWKPRRNYSVNLGVFQTAGWGTLAIVEPVWRWRTTNDREGRASVGYWRLDGAFSRWDGTRATTTQGVYVVAEQLLWRRALRQGGGERGLAGFLQLGKASREISSFASHVGGGFVFRAPWARRPHDSLGVAATWVRLCPEVAMTPSSELVWEVYYRVSLSRKVAFLEDLQYVHHPAFAESNQPVATSHLVVSF